MKISGLELRSRCECWLWAGWSKVWTPMGQQIFPSSD